MRRHLKEDGIRFIFLISLTTVTSSLFIRDSDLHPKWYSVQLLCFVKNALQIKWSFYDLIWNNTNHACVFKVFLSEGAKLGKKITTYL